MLCARKATATDGNQASARPWETGTHPGGAVSDFLDADPEGDGAQYEKADRHRKVHDGISLQPSGTLHFNHAAKVDVRSSALDVLQMRSNIRIHIF